MNGTGELVCSLLEEGTSGERSQCPLDMGGKDPELERVTQGTLLGALVRLVGGYEPASGTWSRTSVSFQLFRGLELGWAHMARDNAAQVLSAVASRLPALSREAWGDDAAELANLGNAKSLVSTLDGATKLDPAYAWLAQGWNRIAWRGEVGAVYADLWYSEIVAPVVEWMRSAGLRSARTLAAGVRMRNSSGAWLGKLKARVSASGETAGTTAALAEYGQPDRTAKIDTWEAFQGSIVAWPEPADLPWSSSPDVPRPILPAGQAAYSIGGGLAAVPRVVWFALGGIVVVGCLAALLWKRRR